LDFYLPKTLSRVFNLPSFITTLITVIGIGSFIYFYTQLIVPGKNYFGNPESLFKNAIAISESGAQIISTRCDGAFLLDRTIGILPTLKVTLYSDGMVIKPLFMDAFGLYYHEISKVEHIKKSIIGIGIFHYSNKVVNPIVLYISENSDVIQVLNEHIGKR
jgi:hypothetical protein